ncbi:MAG: choice-of-anchor B family protein [Acidobacteriota bacterium]|nr:choice-of-anchor B family protein [Acidobacteriota bacterium]
MHRFARLAPAPAVAFALFLHPVAVSAQADMIGFDNPPTIAVSDGHVYIASPGGPVTPGAVHVFGPAPDGWTEVGTVGPAAARDGMGFGLWMSLSGDRMLVGARQSVHVFERLGGDWTEVAVFPSETPAYGGTIAGDLAVLRGNSVYGFEAGPTRVLRRGPSGWEDAGAVEVPAEAEGSLFGAAVAVVDGMVAVGAPRPRASGEVVEPEPGAVYLFAPSADGWAQTGDPIHPVAEGASSFAQGLASGPDGIAVLFVSSSSPAFPNGVVTEHLRDADSGEWRAVRAFASPIQRLGRPSRAAGAVAWAGDELWVGGVTPGARFEGGVLRFGSVDGGGRELLGTIGPEVAEPRGGFGAEIASDGAVTAVKASGRYRGLGAVHVFEASDDGWSEVAEVFVEPANYAAISGAVTCEDGRAGAFDCSAVDILSFVPVREMGGDPGMVTNDVWGWTDPETGREYALVGLSNATSFVDITDAEAPRYVGRMMMPEGANASSWRDIKVYRDHAFVVSDGAGQHGMQVFDLTRLRDAGPNPADFDPDAHYTEIASSHNIIINEATGFAYSVGGNSGGETCGGGLYMIDIREPRNPKFAGCFAHEGDAGGRRVASSHDAMCIVYNGPDEDYADREICFGSNGSAISISDVTDKSNPVAISLATYPDVAYVHQGWITDDHRYFYLGDEGDEGSQRRAGTPFPGTRTLIFDMTDLDDPVFVGEHFGETGSTDHNMYVVGDLLYQSNYTSGLRILDISDRENPKEVGYIDTMPYDDSVAMDGSWSNYPYFPSGTVIVTSGSEGLFMVRYRKPIT